MILKFKRYEGYPLFLEIPFSSDKKGSKQLEIKDILFQAEDGIRVHYVTGVQTCALPICFGVFVPSVGDTEWGRAWAARMQQHSLTPSGWAAFGNMAFNIDVRHVAPTINVPTLILHAVEIGSASCRESV